MGLIHIDLFTTLDGVAQAPGGPDEDADGGFAFGGWQAPLLDEVVGEQVDSGMVGMDALLLGRRTYDIFAAYWPHADGGSRGCSTASRNTWPRAIRRPSSGPTQHCWVRMSSLP
ncbi:bifunctional deaminase-reductase domain protein [Arthrobacter sp. Hiyo4]|nr:bifunctional deaminase-reductase domain protein [Arthrobacter sp. Hiyo4]